MDNELIIYADGACLDNPNGNGGWAWAIDKLIYVSGHVPKPTTNQRMELTAALEALRAGLDILKAHSNWTGRSIVIVSDSKYVVDCFFADPPWWKRWIVNGYRGSDRKPIKNQDLWAPLIELYRPYSNVSFRWVRGHNGDPMNEFVDGLATEAARSGQGVDRNPPF